MPSYHRAAALAAALTATLAPLPFAPASRDAIQAVPAASPSFAEPGLSPDGREIAFVSGGDIWTVSASGGEARLLVSHPATESRPLYSPDGTRVAFVSTRTGNGDVYVLTLASGELTRITYDEVLDQLDGWSRDGKWLYFTSNSKDLGTADVFRVHADGGTPMIVAGDRFASEYWGAPSPDGATLAITARGNVNGQWWRNGHSHLDESEIWLVRPGAGDVAPKYQQLSSGAKNTWPMWSADGRTLYFVSDRTGAQNVFALAAADGEKTQPRQLTRFPAGRVLWPSIAADGRSIAFERDFRIWKMDVASGQAAEVPITLRGATSGPGTEHLTLTSGLRDVALSPDGRKVAFTMRGEIFAAAARDGGDATRVTNTPAPESQIAWAPDSRRIVYVSRRDGRSRLYLYDFGSRAERALGTGEGDDEMPLWSPDGRRIAFVRNGRSLRVLDATGGEDRALADVVVDRPPFAGSEQLAWSPDGQWIATLSVGGSRDYANVVLVPSAGGASRQVSFVANSQAGTLAWTPDGTSLFFNSSQRTEDANLFRVDLVPRTPRFREDLFRDLFSPDAPRPQPGQPVPQPVPVNVPTNGTPSRSGPADTARGATSPARPDSARPSRRTVNVVFDDIRRRTSIVPVGIDVQSATVSPDGKQLLLIAAAANQANLYTYSIDEQAREEPVIRQLTSTTTFKSGAWFSPDGREVFYVDGGRLFIIPLDTRQARPVAISAELDVDFNAEKGALFDEGWTLMRDNFFDPKFNGVDWNASREHYGAFAQGARTPDELRRVMSLMVGDLNASHLGVSGPPAGGAPIGRLGVRFDRATYERDGRLKVSEVLALGPAAIGGVREGEYLVSVNGQPVGAHTNLDVLLERTVGRRVTLGIAREPAGATRELSVRPVSQGAERALLYRAWVEAKRAYVAKISNGKFGYVHIADMSQGSLDQLYADLDVENQSREGVVVDIRNNNGGFVNAYALDVLTRRPYLTMTLRGRNTTVPARPALGQRSLELPTVLVTNQHSLSDAEDFTEGYRTMGLGPVVGEPTAGWIIFTWNQSLLDGTTFRLPRSRIRGANGEDMEMHPRPVDVPVTRPVGESYTGKDSQLDAAVAELGKKRR